METLHLTRFASATLLLCAVAAAFGGCGKPAATRLSTPAGADACQLLSRDEVQTVQGSPVSDAKSSESPSGGLRILQCFYSGVQPDKSVSLAVTTADASATKSQSPLEFWERTFGPYESGEAKKEPEGAEGEKREGAKEEEEGAKNPPKKIDGVGDEAFWSSTHVGGALYVLKKSSNAFLRISVGGADKEDVKIEKSKNLALKALERL